MSLVTQFSDIEGLYLYSLDEFKKLKIKTWERNRPYEKSRIGDIQLEILKNKMVDGIIYLAHIDDQYVCYDGNHRRIALKGLDVDLKVLVSILENPTQNEIVYKFISLNKAKPVPQLYFKVNAKKEIKKLIEDIVIYLTKKYKKFHSKSRNPRYPHFNTTRLNDQLFRHFSEENCYISDLDELKNKLEILNEQYSKNIHINLSTFTDRVIKKCKDNHCYLFLKDFTIDL